MRLAAIMRALGLLLLPCAIGSAAAQDATVLSETIRLDDDAPAIRALAVQSGSRWRIAVDQHGIDAELTITDTSGNDSTYNSRLGTVGREEVLYESAHTGNITLSLRAAARGYPPGSVDLVLTPLAALDIRPDLLAALRAETEAFRLISSDHPGKRQTAVELLAAARATYLGPEDNAQSAGLLRSIGALQYADGQADAAIESFSQAIQLYHDHATGAAPLAAARFGLGGIYVDQGRYAQAMPLLESAARGFDAAGFALESAQSKVGLCLAIHRQEHLDRALRCYLDVLARFASLGSDSDRATVLSNIGHLYYTQQRLEEAARQFEAALDIRAATVAEKDLLITRNNFALALRKLGRIQQALTLYRRNIEVAREAHMNAELALAKHNAAWVLFDLGETAQARALLLDALALRESLGNQPGLVETLNVLARTEIELGRFEDARTHFSRASELATRLRAHEDMTIAEIGIAGIDLDLHHPREALARFEEAVRLASEGEVHTTLDEALHGAGMASLQLGLLSDAEAYLSRAADIRARQPDPVPQTTALLALAELDHARGQTGRALRRLTKAAAIMETTRADLLGGELRASYLAAEHRVYELQTELLLAAGGASSSHEMERTALTISERARARSLLEQVSQLTAHDPAPISATLGTATGHPDARRAQAGAIPAVLDAQALQSMLGADDTLLQFSLGETASALWVIDRDSFQTVRLPGRAVIEDQAIRLHQLISQNRLSRTDDVGEQLRAMQDLLFAHADTAHWRRRLIIAADGALQFTPFDALHDGSAAATLTNLHTIVHAPSLSAVAARRKRSDLQPQRSIAVIADPIYTAEDPRLAAAVVGRGPGEDASALYAVADTRDAGHGLVRLPAARGESSALGIQFSGQNPDIATGSDASRAAVLSGYLSPFRIVHVAAHARGSLSDPRQTLIELSRFDALGHPIRGELSLADILGLKLSADLVVLSACDTALGTERRGEGALSLAYGFLYAGARQVVASSWMVSDEATQVFMAHFYRQLAEHGSDSAEALRGAQLALQGTARYRAPYFWAAFNLYGDWSLH